MSHYVMVTNKLYLYDRTDEYIILCKYGSHNISGYTVTGVEPPKPPHRLPPGPKKAQKSPVCIGLNMKIFLIFTLFLNHVFLASI